MKSLEVDRGKFVPDDWTKFGNFFMKGLEVDKGSVSEDGKVVEDGCRWW